MTNNRYVLVVVLAVMINAVFCAETTEGEGEESKEGRYKIVTIEWKEVKLPMTVGLWIVFSSIAKICQLLPSAPHLPAGSRFQCFGFCQASQRCSRTVRC